MSRDHSKNMFSFDASGDSFYLNLIIFLVNLAVDAYAQPNTSQGLRKDTECICKWLGQEIGPLTPESTEKLRSAFLGYLSIGLAPSFAMQPVFDLFNKHPQSRERMLLKPPAEIMDIFDRFCATEEEINKKRAYDHALEKKKIEQIAAKFKKKPPPPAGLIVETTLAMEKNRFLLGAAGAWFLWVYFRTKGAFELLGTDLHQWDPDMFYVNLLVVPFTFFMGKFLWKTYKNRKQFLVAIQNGDETWAVKDFS